MQCPRCLSVDPKDFYLGSKGYYCRRCITYGRVLLDEEPELPDLPATVVDGEYRLTFDLTAKQQSLSRQLVDSYHRGHGLLYAACGAGKTELVLAAISDALKQGLTVGWAIPRRSVVLQLAQRLQEYFRKLKVVAVCGGSTQVTTGDLIVCTTHQLYRYYQYFDWLIIDEADAFPFVGDPILQAIATTACRGFRLYLSATPTAWMHQVDYELTLFARPHGCSLPVPIEQRCWGWYMTIRLYQLIRHYQRQQQRLLVFFPTKALVQRFSRWMRFPGLWAGHPELDLMLTQLIKGEQLVLFCTSVLERGITIPSVQVIVYHADHDVFDAGMLIQMAGRVGRSINDPTGDVVLLTRQPSQQVEECIKKIQWMNQNA